MGASAAAAVGVGLLAARNNLVGATERAEADNGANLIIGQSNTGSATTQLAPNPSTGPDILLKIDNSSSTTTSQDATAIYGLGPNVTAAGTPGGNGVHGACDGAAAYALLGETDSGYGVVGNSGTGIDLYASSLGRVLQRLQAAVGAPTAGSYSVGEQLRDANGDLYLCVADGAPGTWKRAAAVLPGFTGGALHLLAAPIRLLDTRPGAQAATTPGVPIGGNSALTLQVTGQAVGGVSIPAGAVAVIGNITVVNPQTGGNLIVYPAGGSPPNSSALNYNQGAVVGNGVIAALNGSGQLAIYVNASGSADVVFDAAGFIA